MGGDQTLRSRTRFAKQASMRTTIFAVILTMLSASGCGRSVTKADARQENCQLPVSTWHEREVDPPSLVKVWSVSVQRDYVTLNGKPTSDNAALRAIEATKDYDPGAYVLLDKGTANCSRVRKIAHQVDERFNCTLNYCYSSTHTVR
jgi:hypothetical protein